MHTFLGLILGLVMVAGVLAFPFAAMFAMAAPSILLERRRRKREA